MDVGRAGAFVSALSLCACSAVPESRGDRKPPAAPAPSLQSSSRWRFEDVTESAGVAGTGVTFGAAAADYDGDGWIDLFLSNHYHGGDWERDVSLFRNQHDGTFKSAGAEVFDGWTHGDLHGAAFADFDNDGDQDLMVTSGAEYGEGSCPKLFFVNDHGKLVEGAAAWGLDDPKARGRTPLWVPWESPRQLDLVLTALPRPDRATATAIFRRAAPDRFADASAELGFVVPGQCEFGVLSDLDVDGTLDLLLHATPGPSVFATGRNPLVDRAEPLGMAPTRMLVDLAIADFDGDALPDVFELCSGERGGAAQSDPKSLAIGFYVGDKRQRVEFECASRSIQVAIAGVANDKRRTFVGTRPEPVTSDRFGVRRRDRFPWDDVTRTELANHGLAVGWLPEGDCWVVVAESRDWFAPLVSITADQPIRVMETGGFDDPKTPWLSRLQVHESRARMKEVPVDVSSPGAPPGTLFGRSIASGDFDNDGDVDLFVVQGARTRELPDLLLSNRGDGTFELVPDAAGAAGDLAGSGDSVVTLDYDRDGFLDLFVTNGEGDGPRCKTGQNRLFRNGGGNGNHWLELDLVGAGSNRDSIGASVRVDAGGRVQLREQTGGVHRYSQNASRLHFGLGASATIDELVVRWPSGVTLKLQDVRADQVLTLREPAS